MLYLYHVNAYKYLEIKDQLKVGRSQGDLIISDPALSSMHLCFGIERNQETKAVTALLVEDLNSKNHTAVNKIEILPNHKTHLYANYLIEAGGQSFIVTDRTDLTIKSVNEILEPYLKKTTMKLENIQVINSLKDKILHEITHIISHKQLIELEIGKKNSLISKLHEDETILVKTRELKLMQLEQEKLRVMNETTEKMDQIKKQIQSETTELQSLNHEVLKIDQEIKDREKQANALKKNLLD